jgi:HTH-type transcriptional regulator/antitoxin HigA
MPKTTTGVELGADLDEYLALVRAFPLAHIRDDAHLDAAVAVIDRLLDKGDRSPAEEMYLDALTDLVETYEEAHVAIPARSGVDALRFLMEANDLRQVDLVPVLGRKSLVSEVLSGKRPLTLTHIKKLADYFRVSPAVFID